MYKIFLLLFITSSNLILITVGLSQFSKIVEPEINDYSWEENSTPSTQCLTTCKPGFMCIEYECLCGTKVCQPGFSCSDGACVCEGVLDNANCHSQCYNDTDCVELKLGITCINNICDCIGYYKDSTCHTITCDDDSKCDDIKGFSCVNQTCNCDADEYLGDDTCYPLGCNEDEICHSGFTCINEECVCEGYNDGNDCFPKANFQDDCSFNQQCLLVDENMNCADNGHGYACLCYPGYLFNGTVTMVDGETVFDGSCVFGLNVECLTDYDCNYDYTCDNNSCVCNGYISFGICIPQGCSDASPCVGGFTCDDNNCTCDGYNAMYDCFPGADYLEECEYEDQCRIQSEHMSCVVPMMVCKCSIDYHFNGTVDYIDSTDVISDGSCVYSPDVQCLQDYDCNDIRYYGCIDNMCVCIGYVTETGCNMPGCNDTTPCTSEFSCENNTCVCEGYNNGIYCHEKAGFLENCVYSEQCQFENNNTVCGTFDNKKVCVCAQDYHFNGTVEFFNDTDVVYEGSCVYSPDECFNDYECDYVNKFTCVNSSCICDGLVIDQVCNYLDCNDTEQCFGQFVCINNTCTCDGYFDGSDCYLQADYLEPCVYDEQCLMENENMYCYNENGNHVCECVAGYHFTGSVDSNGTATDGSCAKGKAAWGQLCQKSSANCQPNMTCTSTTWGDDAQFNVNLCECDKGLNFDSNSKTCKPTNDEGSGLSGGAVAGITIGCFALLAIVVAVVVIYKKIQYKRLSND